MLSALAIIVLFHNPSFAEPLYNFSPNADELVSLAFPSHFAVDAVTKGWQRRDQAWHFKNFDQLADWFSDNGHGIPPETSEINVPDDLVDSVWFYLLLKDDAKGIRQFVAEVPKWTTVAQALLAEDWHFSSALEKGLFQHDSFQALDIVVTAKQRVLSSPVAALPERDVVLRNISKLEDLMLEIVRRSLMTASERQELNKIVINLAPPEGTTPVNTYSLSSSYFPPYAQNLSGLFKFEIDEDPWHTKTVGGRSFYQAAIKIPGYTHARVARLWDDYYKKFRGAIHLQQAPPLPDGTETILVRTATLFGENGNAFDSGIIEELLMRNFRTGSPHFGDESSSDYRGTYFYNYRLKRRIALSSTQRLGLQRRFDRDISFSGFTAEVPDPVNTVGASVVTTRLSCINCHSQLFFGASTIFSFNHPPHGGKTHEILEPLSNGQYKLLTPSGEKLRNYLRKGNGN